MKKPLIIMVCVSMLLAVGINYYAAQPVTAGVIRAKLPLVAWLGGQPAAQQQELPESTAAPSPSPEPTPLVVPDEDLAQITWDTLYRYPSHEAPIRLLALFVSTGGASAAIYNEMAEDGKLYPKGVFYQHMTPGSDAKKWTAEALANVPVGLLDTIYAESPELAMAAYEALREANRSDSVEVICCGVTQEILDAMEEDHFSMGAACGVWEDELQTIYADDLT